MQQRDIEADWTDKTRWHWPDDDTELIRVFDYVRDLDRAIELCGEGVAVQAGGACGVWPFYLSRHFPRVVTFEPDPDNYRALLMNVAGTSVECLHGALSDRVGHCALRQGEPHNVGTWYTEPGDEIATYTIDSLQLDRVALICLDVEGAELAALQGAAYTLKQYKPVVMIEEKPLPHMTGPPDAARRWLEDTLGYQVAARVHRDVILC